MFNLSSILTKNSFTVNRVNKCHLSLAVNCFFIYHNDKLKKASVAVITSVESEDVMKSKKQK